ncbi:hypothetical protein DVR12_18410 [Chitinophaga silvatica]|uniref:Organic solvent tolerance-like N-terminal domain-containing protein n=1 Tax=Chitinophaga silvatica TaxID=2282649 RepID=A0A3E1Y6I3_9BACT|nr:OstA-like protein [Chitinophaga silvatica]RFS20539.1 hypothetical protein DVR12_18410 [Chitinophaga silvatica]
MHRYIKSGIFLAVICLFAVSASAQFPTQPRPKSGSVIEIIHADSLIMFERDSISLTRFIGNAVFKQGTTLFNCDSAVKNNKSNVIDAYGNIHINQADSIHIYGNFLNYDANTRIAILRENAKLTDGKVTITAPELQYDMNAKIGSYQNGGRLVNGKSVLTSQEGYYYTETKEMHFIQNVLLVDPEYTLSTSELLYNTGTKMATIVAPTTINNNDKSVMYTTSGYYDTDKGYGNFGNRPTIEDSTSSITADNIEMDRVSGMAYATGNMVYRDTTRKMSLLANKGIVNQFQKTVLATQKPLLIMEKSKDTLYMAADTLFSGVIRGNDSISIPSVAGLKKVPESPTKNLKSVKNIRPPEKFTAPIKIPVIRKDSLSNKELDDLHGKTIMVVPDSALNLTKQKLDPNLFKNIKIAPETKIEPPLDSAAAALSKKTKVQPVEDTTEYRYILAYHNVRMFSDSLQGVADSVYYSSRDSIFRFFKNPVLWSNNTTQLSGDTILLFTKNQTADKMLLKSNGLIVNEAAPGMYNQIKGITITGFVNNEALDWMRVEGNSETINFIKDKENAFMSVNKTQSAIIDIYFKNSEVYKIVFIKDGEGTMYPFTQRPLDQLKLENFKWEIKRKPKSKFELMQ